MAEFMSFGAGISFPFCRQKAVMYSVEKEGENIK